MKREDPDRLISEIEVFLRTGQGPRPTPEPAPPRPPAPRRRVRLRDRVGQAWGRPGVRVAAIVVLGLGVLYYGQHRSSAGLDGPDHASTAPAGPGYTFMKTNPSGAPVRWNPCRPIHYRTNLAAAPGYAADDLQGALDRLSEATGLRFVNDGVTTVVPGPGSEFDGLGRPKPVVIAWAAPTDSPPAGDLHTSELGHGGPGALLDPVTGHAVDVTGLVVIDGRAAGLPSGFGPGALGVVFMHELGHLVGLGHVNDATQVMFPTLLDQAGAYGSGDLAGLARLGTASGCLKVPGRVNRLPF